MSGRSWWLKKRDNYQTPIYYVACGKITADEARTMSKPLAGYNEMIKFSCEAEYLGEIKRLQAAGVRVLT